MHVLFANTGVQVVCAPLRGGVRYTTAQIGYGWQRCRSAAQAAGNGPTLYPYVQWQIIQSGTPRLFLAVETTCGDPEIGYFYDPAALVKDVIIRLENLLDLEGKPLRGVGPIEICIRPAIALAGDPKQVHVVVDFGNSRTGALLLEVSGEIAQTPRMMPFELANRYHFDAWNEEGQFLSSATARWFPSKTHWCNTPYLPPLEQKKIEYHTVEEEERRAGFFRRGRKAKQAKVEVVATPPLFDDLSMVRMGREADDVIQVMRADGDVRTGVSSPKRYLWADDQSWLEGANWFMADPADRCGTGTYASPLRGPYLRFVHEDDRDFLLSESRSLPQRLCHRGPAEAPARPPRP